MQHLFAYNCISFFIHMFIYDMLHPYTLVRLKHTRGLCFPHHGVISPNTFTSAAPRTYSIICIGPKSCLGSIVGFARLPCFGTLRSVLSAKVALGEPLRLRPGWVGRAPQWRKLKLTGMIRRETGRCSRGFFGSLKTHAASSEVPDNVRRRRG